MRRSELEHIIRASSSITKETEIVIVGSQSILGQFPNPNPELLVSMEADVFPLCNPSLSDVIDGNIGERSTFHLTFGYYAHGVDETTAVVPAGWKNRLVPIRNQNTQGATGLCLEVHDLAASKLVAGREKDIKFIKILMSENMINLNTLKKRIATLPVAAERMSTVRERLQRLTARATLT